MYVCMYNLEFSFEREKTETNYDLVVLIASYSKLLNWNVIRKSMKIKFNNHLNLSLNSYTEKIVFLSLIISAMNVNFCSTH